MKYLLIILLLSCCTPERDLQVVSQAWTLVDKKPAVRGETDYVWLIWQDKNGLTYSEIVTPEEADMYVIGLHILNKVLR